jgi:hypothetical protein
VITGAALVLSLASDAVFLRGEGHGEFWWSHVYGFFSLLGFVGCIATILVAKFLGEVWLQRKEDYYDAVGRDE